MDTVLTLDLNSTPASTYVRWSARLRNVAQHSRGSPNIILHLSAFVNRTCHKYWLTITMTAMLLGCVRHTLMTHSFLHTCTDTYYTIDATRYSRLSLTIGLSCLTALAETNKISPIHFPCSLSDYANPKSSLTITIGDYAETYEAGRGSTPGRTRTFSLRIRSPLLYPLSYRCIILYRLYCIRT